jgi:hypothetical protein
VLLGATTWPASIKAFLSALSVPMSGLGEPDRTAAAKGAVANPASDSARIRPSLIRF